MKYTIVDSNYNFVKVKSEFINMDSLDIVNLKNSYKYCDIKKLESKLNSINKDIKNKNIYVNKDIILPLEMKAFTVSVKFID